MRVLSFLCFAILTFPAYSLSPEEYFQYAQSQLDLPIQNYDIVLVVQEQMKTPDDTVIDQRVRETLQRMAIAKGTDLYQQKYQELMNKRRLDMSGRSRIVRVVETPDYAWTSQKLMATVSVDDLRSNINSWRSDSNPDPYDMTFLFDRANKVTYDVDNQMKRIIIKQGDHHILLYELPILLSPERTIAPIIQKALSIDKATIPLEISKLNSLDSVYQYRFTDSATSQVFEVDLSAKPYLKCYKMLRGEVLIRESTFDKYLFDEKWGVSVCQYWARTNYNKDGSFKDKTVFNLVDYRFNDGVRIEKNLEFWIQSHKGYRLYNLDNNNLIEQGVID